MIGILAALNQRHATGRGQRIEVTMQDAVINFNRICFAGQIMTGKPSARSGNQSSLGAASPSELYKCKPGGPNDYVMIYCTRAGNWHWQRLLKVIGREDLSGDARYDTQVARSQRGAEVDEIIAGWTRQHTKEEAMTLISGIGVPAGAVFDTMELQNDPSFEKRGIMQVMEHPNGPFKMPTWPVRVDGQTARIKPSRTSCEIRGATPW